MSRVLTAAIASLALGACLPTHAAFVWNGAGDGVSLFQKANWDADGDVAPPAVAPAAGSIDPAKAVADDLVIGSGTAGGGGASNHLHLGGHSLTMTGGTLKFAATYGIRDDGTVNNDGTRSPMMLTGGVVVASYIGEIDLTLGGTGIIRLDGGSIPVNQSDIDITSNEAFLRFNARTPADVQSTILSHITVNGMPAQVGSLLDMEEPGDNLVIRAFNGTTGAEVQAVPEPAAAMLLAAAGLLALRRQRR